MAPPHQRRDPASSNRQITAILRDYGVPLLNEQGELINP